MQNKSFKIMHKIKYRAANKGRIRKTSGIGEGITFKERKVNSLLLLAELTIMILFLLHSTNVNAEMIPNKMPIFTVQDSTLEITVNTPWVIGSDEPEALQLAIEDVKRDWYKVFGQTPILLTKPPTSKEWQGLVIYMGLNGIKANKLVQEQFPGPESFSLRIQVDNQNRPSLVASGIDIRGSIYAAYTFSEEILGIDPWYFWVDKEPSKKSKINISAQYNRQFGIPTFKYRGWFMNDEDLLNTFSKDPMGENVFSLKMYDHIYETLLRLRGNMVVPGTFIFPDERCQELAARRGLVLNQHHILVVGLNTWRWPKDVPFSYSKHPQIMENYWKACIDAQKDYEVVWSVGLRGKHDRPYWADDPSVKTPEARGALTTKAIAKQVELIRQVQPNADIVANMWMEGVELFQKGYIKLPKGVTLVWPDGGDGIIRDEGMVKAGQGIYYHTAMLSGRHNQLTEMVNPGRIYNQIERFVRAGATNFFLVNVSDIRPVPLSTDCVMKTVWDAKPYLERTDEQNMDLFLRDWSQKEFETNPQLTDKISAVYKKYFDIPYMRLNVRNGENSIISKLKVLNKQVAPLVADSKLLSDDMLKICNEDLDFSILNHKYVSDVLFQAKTLLAEIPDDCKDFYQSHVVTQIEIHLQSLIMLEFYCKSILDYNIGKNAEAISNIEKALEGSNNLFSALSKAEYGKWVGWYMGETFVNLNEAYDLIRTMQSVLRHEPIPPIRNMRDYKDVYKYQEPFLKNFPLLYPKTIYLK